MKIAFLNIYQDKVNRGAETFVSELTKRLSKNHEVDVISQINYLALFSKKYNLIIPTNGRLQVILVRIITWLTGCKMIVSGQSGKGWDDRLNLYALPNAFVALSTYVLNWAKRVNPFVKSVYIPNGVDLREFVPQGVTLRSSKVKTVISIGAFTKEKRHDLTIMAVSMLKDAKLIIVGGGGDYKKETKRFGFKVLGKERFEILTVPHDKIPELLRKSDVLDFSSVPWESFGIVLVEAMASGLPVVASDDPIRREIVGDAGLFVDPTNIEAYAEALKKALDTNWGNKPRKQAEKFSWDKIALQYEKLFKEL